MPAPGSHRDDQRLHREQRRLEGGGARDGEAARRSRAGARSSLQAPPDEARGDRAGGPLGERGGGGEPGGAIGLRSPAFATGGTIPPRYSRPGDNLSPPLEWSGVPEAAAELALVCEDPDAPGGIFTHWLLTGIDPATSSIDAGAAPARARAWPNDFGAPGYDGPQPPVGDPEHRYVFRLFALPSPVAGDDRDRSAVRAALDERPLATGTLVGTFVR